MNSELSKQIDSGPEQMPAVTDYCVNCGGDNCGGGNSCGSRCNLHSYNWLADIPGGFDENELVEVHFKNTRKSFYRNSAHLPLKIGDVVAVEANPGHDIGTVAMLGRLVKLQMKRANLRQDFELLRVFRKAKEQDLQRFAEAKAKEVDTMIRSRKIAVDLGLKMKIGDVEYQGDGNKAIFYYIADERVDFRQLIKVLAEVFKIRVEMKQIGARQEAGRIGGIGPCGRPLCCASWMTNFVSVATSAARYQDISLNPQKLAGQCAKLKCCMNFEVDSYVEATKQLPPRDIPLETVDGTYYHFKTDIFKKEMTYSTDKRIPANLVVLSAERVLEVIELNAAGEKPEKLLPNADDRKKEHMAFGDILGQDAINRFDKKKKKKNKKSQPKKQQAQVKEEKSVEKAEDRPQDGSERRPRNNAKRNRGRRENRERNNDNRNGKNMEAPKQPES